MSPEAPATTVVKPKLVVLIVIDQYPSWSFAQQRDLFTGGLARMLREGAVVARAELPYANTFTAAGHAAIGTGAPPRVSGIVGNYWHRRDEGRDRPAEYDANAMPFAVGPALGTSELSPDDGVSAKALRVGGIAESLRAGTSGAGRSVAIAFKARSACLVAGKRPDLAIWFEAGGGGMTTSRAYAREAPAWLVKLASTSPASRFFTSTWEPRDASLLERATKIIDASPGEKSNHGLDGAFPHALTDSDRPERSLQETPFADEIVVQTAREAIAAMKLGTDEVPDLLALSFSAHDYAGHAWGPDSWEIVDLTLRLDTRLGELFDELDRSLGRDQWAAVLTSDHGATPIVERSRVAGARRLGYDELETAALSALEAVLPDRKPWTVHVAAGNVYITPHLAGASAAERDAALDAAAKALAAVPNVAAAGRTDRIGSDCTKGNELERAICNAHVSGEAGDLYVYPALGSVISGHSFGTGHDAPFEDNRFVPILVKAPGLAPRQVETGSLLQVAPTVTSLLGVAPPPAATESPLFGLRSR